MKTFNSIFRVLKFHVRTFKEDNEGYMVLVYILHMIISGSIPLAAVILPKYIIDAISANDINKTIMRCLVKNLAMFGLGLYIYAGEDLPEEPPEPKIDATKVKALHTLLTSKGITDEQKKEYLKVKFGLESSKDLTMKQYKEMTDYVKKKPDVKKEEVK